MNNQRRALSGEPFDPAARAEVANLLATVGERRVIEILGISGPTLGRLLGGMSVHKGTAALVRQQITAHQKHGDKTPA